MNYENISIKGNVVTITLPVNGRVWEFSHQRGTDADAENLHRLAREKLSSESLRSRESIEWRDKRITALLRSNAGLRGQITKLRRKEQT